ncbi:MAG TPA: methyltransferase domain-containing protein [Spirochaetia bacterium]|nr:methyltransferase domain-containing protein [Spirochaetia bacterium]
MHEKRFNGDAERLRSPERVKRLEVERVVEACLSGGIKNVLDVGTGTGLFAEGFLHRGVAVSGVDASPDMVTAAKKHLPDTEIRVGTAEKLPFEDKSFDLVFLGLVFHETDDPAGAVAEALRVARKRIAILEWPFRTQEIGPPLVHRVNLKQMKILLDAIFTDPKRAFASHSFPDVVLYQVDLS